MSWLWRHLTAKNNNQLCCWADAVVRGHRSGLLTSSDYNNLAQCESLDDIKLNLVSAVLCGQAFITGMFCLWFFTGQKRAAHPWRCQPACSQPRTMGRTSRTWPAHCTQLRWWRRAPSCLWISGSTFVRMCALL